jgi:hypothetical protein
MTDQIDLGFSWRLPEVPDYYPPKLTWRELRRDDFAFLLLAKAKLKSLSPVPGSAAFLFGQEVSIPRALGLSGLDGPLRDKLERAQARPTFDGYGGGHALIFTPHLARNVPKEHELLPLIEFVHVPARVDAVCTADTPDSVLGAVAEAAKRAFDCDGKVGPITLLSPTWRGTLRARIAAWPRTSQ